MKYGFVLNMIIQTLFMFGQQNMLENDSFGETLLKCVIYLMQMSSVATNIIGTSMAFPQNQRIVIWVQLTTIFASLIFQFFGLGQNLLDYMGYLISFSIIFVFNFAILLYFPHKI